MKLSLLLATAVVAVLFTSCSKKDILPLTKNEGAGEVPGFTHYLIPAGKHYATSNPYKIVDVATLRFTVRFDSSCIYTAVLPENQLDIHKLYGFADNNAQHHQFSARIGWRWSNNALRLFAYTYNNGLRAEKEISTISIGSDVSCSIKVAGDSYQFAVNEASISMPRLSTTTTAKGYQLYPYFGGSETAPHDVHIWIKE